MNNPSQPVIDAEFTPAINEPTIDASPKSYHTFITDSKRGPVEYAIKPKGQIVRLTPKPLNKKQRRKLFKQQHKA